MWRGLGDDTCGPGKVFDTDALTGEPLCRDEKAAPSINAYYCGQFPGTAPYHTKDGKIKCVKPSDVDTTSTYLWIGVAVVALLLLKR